MKRTNDCPELTIAMDWKSIRNLETVPSPALLVDADRVAKNIEAMIGVVGKQHAGRLRPHVKTHKMTEVVRLKLESGITKFKAATLVEAKMIANAGGPDVLIAYPLVGPNLRLLQELIDQYPGTSFAAIVDHVSSAKQLAERVGSVNRPLRVYIDVDCGMHRTGIPVNESLDRLRMTIESTPELQYAGLHVYDGHSHSSSLEQRKSDTAEVIDTIASYERSSPSPAVIGGGSPTFAIWADSTDWECSLGTSVFWDCGYGTRYSEMPFTIAAALLTRVISKPGGNRICFDLGYKAIASDKPFAERVVIPAIDDAVMIGHSEEHLVLESKQASSIEVGQEFIAFPRHICPTVALYRHATIIRNQVATDEVWQVTARDRC